MHSWDEHLKGKSQMAHKDNLVGFERTLVSAHIGQDFVSWGCTILSGQNKKRFEGKIQNVQ